MQADAERPAGGAPGDEPDVLLLWQTAAGDGEAFRKFYERHHRRVYFFLFRMVGEQSAAEDVLAETFTAAWRQAGSFQGRSAVSTWLLGIARNLANNHLRCRRDHENLDDHEHLSGEARSDLEQSDRARVMAAALQRLSAKHREALDLVFYHELKYGEIAELLGIPTGTVKTRVLHAKEALRAVLTKMEVRRDAI